MCDGEVSETTSVVSEGVNITELQRLARPATPGPWQVLHADDGDFWLVQAASNEILADLGWGLGSAATAAYIAACSPERILALTEAVEALEETARAGISWAPPGPGRLLRERVESALDAFTGHGEAVASKVGISLESKS